MFVVRRLSDAGRAAALCWRRRRPRAPRALQPCPAEQRACSGPSASPHQPGELTPDPTSCADTPCALHSCPSKKPRVGRSLGVQARAAGPPHQPADLTSCADAPCALHSCQAQNHAWGDHSASTRTPQGPLTSRWSSQTVGQRPPGRGACGGRGRVRGGGCGERPAVQVEGAQAGTEAPQCNRSPQTPRGPPLPCPSPPTPFIPP